MTEEPHASQVSDISMADTSDTVITSIPHETADRFERGEDMRALYDQMRPDQRTAVAGEFIRLLTLAGDDQAERFRQDFQRHTQLTDGEDATEELLTAEQVAAIDQYVREKHPELIAQMLRHPVTQSALRIPGAPPQVPEEAPPSGVDQVIPTEDVATSGAAYTTSWEMMEQGGEEANRLAEAPHERAVTPEGELERAQRQMEIAHEKGQRPPLEPPENTP